MLWTFATEGMLSPFLEMGAEEIYEEVLMIPEKTILFFGKGPHHR